MIQIRSCLFTGRAHWLSQVTGETIQGLLTSYSHKVLYPSESLEDRSHFWVRLSSGAKSSNGRQSVRGYCENALTSDVLQWNPSRFSDRDHSFTGKFLVWKIIWAVK